MKEFMLLFRSEPNPEQPSAEEMHDAIKMWQDWIGGIAAQGKFVATNALEHGGKVVNHAGVITDGPYAETKEIINGYIIVKADTFEEAIKLGEGCPVYAVGGKVEVRPVMSIKFGG